MERRGEVTLSDAVLWCTTSPAIRRTMTGRLRSSTHPERGRLKPREARAILQAGWTEYARLAPTLPPQPTVGSRLLVRMAGATLALCRELQAHGVDRADALAMLGDASWRIYGPAERLSGALARTTSRDGQARVRARVDSGYRFPFNPPGWRYEPQGEVGYDIVHCPIAAYLCDQGAADLCAAVFCAQDFAGAEVWGLRLDRSETLAEGRERCAFRYSPAHTTSP